MSFQRRSLIPAQERYNRILKIANLDPLSYGYEAELEEHWGLYLNQRVKEDFLTQVSMLANERLMTHDIRSRQGRIYGQTFNLTVGQPVRIDFLGRTATGFSSPVTLSTGQAVWMVRIVNKCTGDLLYSINTMDNGSVLLPANGPAAVHDAPVERYEAVNLQAIGSNATVNVAVEI